MTPSTGRRSWSSLLWVAAFALATVIATDRLLAAWMPPPNPPELDDGLSLLEDQGADVLVFGSSHLRSFFEVARQVAERTGGRVRVTPLPMDWGHAASYEFMHRRRVAPWLDGPHAPDQHLPRKVLLVTQWWDFRRLGPDDDPVVNLPARAWQVADFLADAAREGLTDYNRHYLSRRLYRALRRSPLWAWRGRPDLREALKSLGRREPDPRREARRAERVAWFRGYIERGGDRLVNPEDAAALEALLDDWQRRGLEVRVLLYPRMKGSITPAAREGTLLRFSRWMESRLAPRGIPLLDLSLDHPLTDEDFGPDLDHPTHDANARLAAFLLDGPWGDFLLTSPGERP